MIASLPARTSDGAIHVVVESPRGSTSKLKFDAAQDVMLLSRPLPAGLTYPHDWGFVPSTRAADGDPLDAFIAWTGMLFPGVVVPCRAIGALKVEQTNVATRQRERNDRLAVLPVKAAGCGHIASVFEFAERWRLELEQFFTAAVAFEGKDIALLGWVGPDEANATLDRSIAKPA